MPTPRPLPCKANHTWKDFIAGFKCGHLLCGECIEAKVRRRRRRRSGGSGA